MYKRTNLKSIFRYLLIIVVILCNQSLFAQHKVGLVLSGGGASGLAHIGVLKALEERGVPIDYITGTSAGALIGALYSSGYSPLEIEQIVISDAFQKMSRGELEPDQHFSYREPDPDASMVSIGASTNSLLRKSLPTNFKSSAYLDYTMLEILGTTGESRFNNFDSLFVPFRCVASDIVEKKSVVFKEGHLNQKVRASITYPFYFTPIRVDSTLLFDGGLYNNFPADVMYQDFNPDFIIGSNVSYNAQVPEEQDLISQVTNMLVSYTNYSLPCELGVLIEPKTDVSTFEFDNVEEVIEAGYREALIYLDSICLHVTDRVDSTDLAQRRAAFRSKIVPLSVSSLSNTSDKSKKIQFAQRSMIKLKKEEIITENVLERRYFRLNATPQIEFIYPTISLKSDSTYNLDLKITKSKDLKLDVGGHVSSRAVNTGFVGLSYRILGKTASTLYANTYFGKFYGSTKVSYTLEIPSIYPVSVSGYFVMNRWDYFRSFATFFEDVKPSFLVQNEMFFGLNFKHPIGNTTKSILEAKYFLLEDNYYQSDVFSNVDTSDFTQFQGVTGSWEFEQNSLNRKQFANSGHYASFKVRYVYGKEHSLSGSTAPIPFDNYKYHSWLNLSGEFRTFVIDQPVFHLGIHGTAVFNTQSLFSNYTSSILAMTAYAPLPDMHTYFLEEHRSPQYIGLGTNIIFTIKRKLDIRLDGYYYQPFVTINKNEDGTFGYSKPFKGETYVASGSVIYNSFLGPIRATVNYFPKQVIKPLSFQISFGYILFNNRAIR